MVLDGKIFSGTRFSGDDRKPSCDVSGYLVSDFLGMHVADHDGCDDDADITTLDDFS